MSKISYVLAALLAVAVLVAIVFQSWFPSAWAADRQPPEPGAGGTMQDSPAQVAAMQATGEQPWQDNGLPVLYLTIDPQELDKVNASEDHGYRASGATMRLEVPEGYVGEYATEPLEGTGELTLDYLRGRGHGTWSADKKPYKIKLENGVDLLGMGKSKHWVLLANRYDETQLRNRIVFYIAARMGSPYAVQCLPVDVVVNGEYHGSYLLSEDVRIGSSRVDIDELTEDDAIEPELTGGYLLCMCPLDDEPLENALTTNRLVRFGAEEPQFTEDEGGLDVQKAYIADYLQRTEDAIFSPDLCDADGVPYTEYMDARSAVDYWWMQEYSGNADAFITSSTYLYKERSGKLSWGPLWDFDLSLGGGLDDITGFLHRNMAWLDHLRAYDPQYQALLRERWALMSDVLDDVLEPGGILDQYADEVRSSWEDDARRWPLVDDDGQVHEVSFDESVESLRTWMRLRQSWINEHIDDELTQVYDTVSFVADGQVVATADALHDRWLDRLPPAPAKDGFVFVGWQTEDGETYEGQPLGTDSTLVASYLPEESVTTATGLFFLSPNNTCADINQRQYSTSYELKPADAVDKNVRWSSSNPEVAQVDEYGNVLMMAPGDATITATLDSGVSGSYDLLVYDSLAEEPQVPTSIELIEPDGAELRLSRGECAQVLARLLPQPNTCYLTYSSDDEQVAEVDYFGVVEAKAPGTTTIWVAEDSGELGLREAVTVVVE